MLDITNMNSHIQFFLCVLAPSREIILAKAPSRNEKSNKTNLFKAFFLILPT